MSKLLLNCLAVLLVGQLMIGDLQGQQPGKFYRIGVLNSGSASGLAPFMEAFRQELGRLGWTEGKQFSFEIRFAENQGMARVRALAAELVGVPVDILLTFGGGPTAEAKKLTGTIPIVMVNASDPVAAGLVASLARPGGNVTGLASLSPELNTKRLEILKDLLPKLTRVGFLFGAGGTTDSLQLKEMRLAARSLKLHLEEIEADVQRLENAFELAKQKQIGALVPQAIQPFFTARKRLIELAIKYKLPAIFPQRPYADAGALIVYGADTSNDYRLVAQYVDKILRGAKPADLPAEQPRKFEFIVNLKTAKLMGLNISPEFLSRANQVIK